MNASRPAGMKPTLMAVAVASAFGLARAQERPDIAQLAEPGTSVTVGIEHATGDQRDRARFGMFNGLREHDTNGLLGFSYINRPETGPWTTVYGRNLTLDNREAGLIYRRAGEYKFTAEYSEITRHDPRTINTSLQGAGSTTPTVTLLPTPGTGQDLNLQLQRKAISLGAEAWVTNRWQVETAFRNEDKDGARLWGKGFACSASWQAVGACTGTSASAVLMLPEPVDSTIKQADARLNYLGEQLSLSFAYYGSFYTNRNGNLTPTIGLTQFGNQNGGLQAADAGLNATMGLPMALWPDNQAHTLSAAGNYRFTRSTRVNFKYAYTQATQDESFAAMGLTGAPAGRNDLGGRIDTTKAQLGFSTHATQKLHVHGDFAYVHKDNKTPLAPYNLLFTNATGSTATYTNGNQSPTKIDIKLEAAYQLMPATQVSFGVKREHEDYDTFTPTDLAGGVSGLKQKLVENSWRAELRRSMSETFTGAISYERAERKGQSSWLKPNSLPATGVTELSDAAIFNRTAIFPFIYMDRTRDKVRFMGNWTPTEKLSLQLFADSGQDRYSGPTEHGLRTFKMGNVAVDASYQLSDAWKFSAFASRGEQTVNAGHSTGYDADLKDTTTAVGFGTRGALTGQLRVGADWMWNQDILRYHQVADPLASPANATFLATSGGLPDVTYRVNRLNLYGEYAMLKNAYVRLDYIRYHSFFNEWTYSLNGVPFLYSDNTTINALESQTVNVVAATVTYKF